jgi:4-hydroxybenzoate polyprenyltransferase
MVRICLGGFALALTSPWHASTIHSMKIPGRIFGFLKLEHTLFSLPLLFAGAALGLSREGQSLAGLAWTKAAGIVLAGIGARTLALSLNRLMDRALDAKNPRTRSRELPSGKLTVFQGWLIGLAGFLIYIGAAYALGFWPLVLAPIPLLVFAVYPQLKRFTVLSHFGVGAGLALAPLGGYVGAVDRFPEGAAIWVLAAFTFAWVSGFDVLYAIEDEKFDRQHKLFSIPGQYGRKTAVRAGYYLHGLSLACLVALWAVLPHRPGSWSWAAILPAGILLAAEQKLGGSFSLDSHALFFKVNAWMGFAVLFFVLLVLY